MISRTTRACRSRSDEAEFRQIQFVDKKIDDARKGGLADPILKPIREQHRLAALDAPDETRHPEPLPTSESLPRTGISTQPRP